MEGVFFFWGMNLRLYFMKHKKCNVYAQKNYGIRDFLSGSFNTTLNLHLFKRYMILSHVSAFFLAQLHPGRLTWTIIMEVWKIIFLSKWVICRFHVNLPRCTNTQYGLYLPTFTINWCFNVGKIFHSHGADPKGIMNGTQTGKESRFVCFFSNILGGGFMYFFMFTPKIGEDEPNLTIAYYSDGVGSTTN